jgi:hypothetical protein
MGSGKTYVFDIDGVICCTKNGNYKNAVPIKCRIKQINVLGIMNKIIYYTARGSETGKNWRKLTKKQFSDWGVHYDKLIMGKPYGNFYVDDKAINSNDFFK